MDPNVLIVFSSARGETERLALAVGVGAIQARASIRLRRLPPQAEALGGMTKEECEAFERMARDYVPPRAVDCVWADVVIVACSSAGAPDVQRYVEQLPAAEPVASKVAAVITTGDSHLLTPIYAAAVLAGLVVVPAPPALASLDDRQRFGRELAAFARALKVAHTSSSA